MPVTSRGVPSGFEKLRLPHFLDNWLTDGSEVVSLTRWPPFTPRNFPHTHFCYRLMQPQVKVHLEGLGKFTSAQAKS
jgi:hypothetical protein